MGSIFPARSAGQTQAWRPAAEHDDVKGKEHSTPNDQQVTQAKCGGPAGHHPDPDDRHDTQPVRPDRRTEAAGMAPSLEHDDDREPDDDEREEEVRHHRERMEAQNHRDSSEWDLRHRAEERRERDPPDPRRQALDPPGGEPCHHRDEQTCERDDPVAELDESVEVRGRERRLAAAGPVVAAETRSGQPDERSRGDDEP